MYQLLAGHGVLCVCVWHLYGSFTPYFSLLSFMRLSPEFVTADTSSLQWLPSVRAFLPYIVVYSTDRVICPIIGIGIWNPFN